MTVWLTRFECTSECNTQAQKANQSRCPEANDCKPVHACNDCKPMHACILQACDAIYCPSSRSLHDPGCLSGGGDQGYTPLPKQILRVCNCGLSGCGLEHAAQEHLRGIQSLLLLSVSEGYIIKGEAHEERAQFIEEGTLQVDIKGLRV